MIAEWLRQRFTDHTPGVGRVFVVCGGGRMAGCNRIIPYYRLYGEAAKVGCIHCGGHYFRPAQIPEWKAALWVLWGHLSRKGDPRMPMRTVLGKYA